jgi:hypothetical protein
MTRQFPAGGGGREPKEAPAGTVMKGDVMRKLIFPSAGPLSQRLVRPGSISSRQMLLLMTPRAS